MFYYKSISLCKLIQYLVILAHARVLHHVTSLRLILLVILQLCIGFPLPLPSHLFLLQMQFLLLDSIPTWSVPHVLQRAGEQSSLQHLLSGHQQLLQHLHKVVRLAQLQQGSTRGQEGEGRWEGRRVEGEGR